MERQWLPVNMQVHYCPVCSMVMYLLDGTRNLHFHLNDGLCSHPYSKSFQGCLAIAMVRASEAQAYAKQGVWTEWSRGSVTGLTVSLSEQHAAILVAGLALFVQMMGTRLWVILRFLVHQLRVTTKVRPAYYHQQQALLRNSGSSSSFLVDIIYVVARWRKKLGRSIGSFSVLWLLALDHLISLTVLPWAAVFKTGESGRQSGYK